MSARIEDYAMIGDGETAALVARDGSIDWLCWPRFDSPACFAALLGDTENGHWRIAPQDRGARITRRYREGTLILETEFETETGAVTVIDFMPPRGGVSDLIRIVRGRRGRVPMRLDFSLRFDYGRTVPWVTQVDERTVRAIAGPDLVVLRSSVPLTAVALTTIADFDVCAGESATFGITYSRSHAPLPDALDPEQALIDTEASWLEWSARSTYEGDWAEAVQRSLITLKALIYHPTGGVVAAPTTSLPEYLDGRRNWDYRFCWLRDATLTLLALMDAGYIEEADAWRTWLLRAVAGSPDQLQIMYGLAGERRLTEWEVTWLAGYERSKPVRVGNAAHDQFQLDVYGEVIDALYQARKGGLEASPEAWQVMRALVSHVETVWAEPDEGIWEVRGGRQHFTHSKVMAWVALDRAIQGAEQFGWRAPVERWRGVRARIHAEVCARGFDTERNSFVQAFGSKALDASLLMLPLVGFLPPTDPRVLGTVAAIERELTVDGLVMRYDPRRTDDGLSHGEGAFLACSFWLVDNLVLQGRIEEARARFERLLGLRNDVGLLAEEYDPRAGRMLGNFPQAFSHIGLIDSALNLSRSAGAGRKAPADQRSHSASSPVSASNRSGDRST